MIKKDPFRNCQFYTSLYSRAYSGFW